MKALNGENNVVDDKAVSEVISILETYPITRATLEQTRIGKTVNELRKKIKDEKLAKRAKQLVRSWKNILDGTVPVVNGEKSVRPGHPAVAALQVSPAMSPGLSRTPPSVAGRGVSPALSRDIARTSAASSRLASPALPATGKPLTPTAAKSRVASPALAGNKLGGQTPVTSQRVASPALAVSKLGDQTPLSSRVISPSLPGSKPRTPLLASASRVASPGIDSGKAGIRPSSATSSPALSPSPHPSTPGSLVSRRELDAARAASRDKSRVNLVAGREDTSSSGRATPTGRLTPSSIHSENSQDRVLGDRGNGAADSDSESNSNFSRSNRASFNHQNNHSSSSATLSKSSDRGSSSKDQRDLSKANVANRKRTREHSLSPPEVSSKQLKLESSGLSVNSNSKHERTINGCVKSGKKTWSGPELPRVSSTCSLPANFGRLSSPKSQFTTGNGEASVSDSLQHQESVDSRLSSQSFDRPSRDKHKVKTTEQLIEQLQKKNNSSRVGASVINDLRTNQIEREKDVQGSVLPPGVKPRGRKSKRGKDDVQLTVPSSDVTLSQAKNELVERFLETSDPSSTVEEYSPFKDDLLSQRSDSVLEPSLGLGACSHSFSKGSFDSGFAPSLHHVPRPGSEEKAEGEGLETGAVSTLQDSTGALSLEQIYAQLPPVDDDVDWDAVGFYELPETEPVTDEVVNRLHTTQWAGVNGLYDINGDWQRWHQTVTMPSYEGDMLHVLPYVDLD